MSYIIEKRVPRVDEFNHLRSAAGWPLLEESLTQEGLRNSLFGVCILNGKTICAMGRIVGDDGIYFHISDVIVHPDFQRLGYGEMVMNELMAYVTSKGGKHTNVGLMCSIGREPFYERFGFQRRPSPKFGAGMIKILD